jgi:23S rRNA (pseudouridine1915-N3)-methyltransferase
MKELSVVWVGRRAPQPWQELVSDYEQRIARFASYREVRVRPVEGRAHDVERALAQEGDAILAYLRPEDHLVALDERGRQLSTLDLARLLERVMPTARVVFAIGSDLGLGAAVKVAAREVVALSRLTLPHQLARLLLLEQLYRALDLNAGGSYHRP